MGYSRLLKGHQADLDWKIAEHQSAARIATEEIKKNIVRPNLEQIKKKSTKLGTLYKT